jgi:Interleukin-like EMT inducer
LSSWRLTERPPRPAGTGWTAHGLAFLAALALVLAATWPLARELGGAFPDNTDPRLFSWVMQSVFRNLVARPALLFHGNAFYPLGQSLTLAEPLLTPALVAGPLLVLTGNAVLAYNVTLVLLWALSGWATYAVTGWITGSRGAAVVAMLVFTVAPARVEYAVEFQIEMTAGIPLAVYAGLRFLEGQRLRHLAAFVAVFWAQAVAVWYYAVILGVGLALLAIQYVALHWTGWQKRALVALAGGGVLLGAALAPVAVPYFVTRAELGLERGLEDIDSSRYADLATYLEARESRLWRGLPWRTGAETSLFVGGGALVLAASAAGWLVTGRAARRGPAARVLGWGTGACLVLAAVAALSGFSGHPLRIGPVRSLLTAGGVGALGCLVVGEVLEGRRRWRAGVTERRLAEPDWVRLLGGLALLAFLLSLGPVVHADGRPLGSGLYGWLYPYLFPLHAIRSPTRFGILVLFAVALLAGFGFRWYEERVGPRGRLGLVTLAVLLLVGEYASTAETYLLVRPRAVDTVLAAEAGDGAVLEWPLGDPDVDVDAEFRSLRHGRRLVNGFAGFASAFHRELSGTLDDGRPPLATEDAQAALRALYPLRFFLVRTADLPADDRESWAKFRRAPPLLLRFRGTFEDVDLYEIRATPEHGHTLQRLVAYDLLVRRPVLHLELGAEVAVPRSAGASHEWVSVSLNDRLVARVPLRDTVVADVRLDAPLRRAAPNVVTLAHGTEGPGREARFPVGTTGATSPGHLRVRSGGQAHGDLVSVQLDGAELASPRRGYTLVAWTPDGRVPTGAVFDTFAQDAACAALSAWIDRLPAGAVVAGAVKDEASARLCSEGVAALRRLGVRGDLRGRFRESHAFVGAKGAAPGQALEALGAHPVEVEVGRPIGPEGFELRALELRADRPGAVAAGRAP